MQNKKKLCQASCRLGHKLSHACGLLVGQDDVTQSLNHVTEEDQFVELTEDQKRTIKAIMEKVDCPHGFNCFTYKFEDLCPVRRFYGVDLVECQHVNGKECPMAKAFSGDMRFCTWELRKYLALEVQE